MRTYGRVTNADGSTSWLEVETDANGNNDLVMLTTLCQVLKLSLNESPFFSDYGIPQHSSIMQQIAPDYYMSLTQQRFASSFASLSITKVSGTTDPTYNVSVITHQGVPLSTQVAT